METLKYFTNNTFVESTTDKYYNVFDPSTGEQIARCPRVTADEIKQVIANAEAAYKVWSKTPVIKRVQILYRLRELLVEHMDELTLICAREHGKVYEEAKGDILKAKEGTELAISMPSLMMGESLMDTSSGYDTVLYRESLGVFVGICPFNFPAMIPMGWMAPSCIACGNTIILKVAGATPMTSLRIAELYREAGLPDGDHALVLNDAALDRTAAGIVNAAYGCAGERCMALPVVVAQEGIADALVAKIKELASALKVGPAYDKTSKLGPVYSAEHKKSVVEWIEKGLAEGATLVLDGRDKVVEGYENGFYLGPTVLDHVTTEMTVGTREIFGPVLCIKRVKTFEEGLEVMNSNPFANGSVIYTQNGYYAREFARNTDGGMVGINVGIPVPVGVFPFSGHKQSFFGDLHCLGKDAYRFFTESKCVTTHWFDEHEKKSTAVSTWDGTI